MAAQLGEVCCNQPRFPRRASGQNCRFLVIFRENFSLKMCLDFLPFTFIKIPKRNTCTWSCLTRIFDRSHQTHSIPLPLSGMMISNSYLITLSLLYIHIVFTWHHLVPPVNYVVSRNGVTPLHRARLQVFVVEKAMLAWIFRKCSFHSCAGF